MASGLRVKKGRLIGCTKGATDIKLYAVMDASGRPIILVIGEHVFFAGVHELGELDAAQAVPRQLAQELPPDRLWPRRCRSPCPAPRSGHPR